MVKYNIYRTFMTTINSLNMKQLIEYTRSFFKSHFGLKLYLAMAVYFAFLMIVNYSLDLERGWLYSYMGEWKSILFFFLTYGISFYGAIGVIWAVDIKRLQLGKTFWVKSLLGILFLAFYRSGFYLVVERFIYEFPPTTRRFYAGIFRNVFRLVVVMGGLLAFKQVFDKNEKWGLYGLGKQGGNPWAYMLLLLFVSPFIFLATYLPGFLEAYPLYKEVGGARFAEYYAISEWIPAFIFEFQYLLDFINTELFFQGVFGRGFY